MIIVHTTQRLCLAKTLRLQFVLTVCMDTHTHARTHTHTQEMFHEPRTKANHWKYIKSTIMHGHQCKKIILNQLINWKGLSYCRYVMGRVDLWGYNISTHGYCTHFTQHKAATTSWWLKPDSQNPFAIWFICITIHTYCILFQSFPLWFDAWSSALHACLYVVTVGLRVKC